MDTPELSQHASIPDCYYLERIEQLQVMADPLRYRIIKLLDRPRTGAQLARELGLTRAKTHYHIKQLEGAALIRVDHIDTSTGMVEKYYTCVARFFSFARLLPDASDINDPVITAASYKAVADFLSATIEVSRDIIAHRPLDLSRDAGIWMEKSVVTSRRKMAVIREKISALREEILALEHDDINSLSDEEIVRFNAMLFLTPEIMDRNDPNN